MIAVIQRVSQASVNIEQAQKNSIGKGLMVLIGITHLDTEEDSLWLSKKVTDLRIFSDIEDKMNLSLKDIQGELLIVSQFTLHASTKKGNRPSFIEASKPNHAIPLYQHFIQCCEENLGYTVKTGVFGANMQVELINDGPVTIIIDTKNKI